MRRVARESVFQLIFEYSFYETTNDETLSLMLLGANLSEDDKQFIVDTYNGVASRYGELKDIVASSLDGYSIERVYRPDLTALLLATYELVEGAEPDAVIINEAVSLAKKFGSEKSGKFVNGVLVNVLKNVRNRADA